MKHLLSKIIPMPFKATYQVISEIVDDGNGGYMVTRYEQETSRWWQWRGKIIRLKTEED